MGAGCSSLAAGAGFGSPRSGPAWRRGRTRRLDSRERVRLGGGFWRGGGGFIRRGLARFRLAIALDLRRGRRPQLRELGFDGGRKALGILGGGVDRVAYRAQPLVLVFEFDGREAAAYREQTENGQQQGEFLPIAARFSNGRRDRRLRRWLSRRLRRGLGRDDFGFMRFGFMGEELVIPL